VTAVLDPIRTNKQKSMHSKSFSSITIIFGIDWSLRSLFERSITKTCPFAQETLVQVTLPSLSGFTIIPTSPVERQSDVEETEFVETFELDERGT
jgi:hypothetical protein